jgi:DNA-binding NarL/FixJ family response regulator
MLSERLPPVIGSSARRRPANSSSGTSPPGAPDRRPPRELQFLTDRESEVLRLVAAGLSNQELADRLHIGEGTVKTHVARTLAKLGCRDRVQAVVYAYEHGFVRPGRY